MLEKTKQLCQQYNIIPERSKGQNFLINEKIYDNIVEVANITREDVILEVGPGLGFLTEKLAKKAKKVIAVELDDKLANFLEKKFNSAKNINIINNNILEFFKFGNLKLIQNSKFKIQDYKIVANLPYNITSIFLRKILSAKNKPKSIILMLQKEVAERITAKSGKMSLLAVSVQLYADAKIVQYVDKENFWPKPAVDSAVIQLKVKNKNNFINTAQSNKEFFRLLKIGFSSKRKMLKNNLANGYHISQKEAEEWIAKAGFDIKIRAQELLVEDWKKLLKHLA